MIEVLMICKRQSVCPLQGRVDAQEAVNVLLAEQQSEESSDLAKAPVDAQLASAYLRLGEAYFAEKDHPDRNCRKALEVSYFLFTTHQACL